VDEKDKEEQLRSTARKLLEMHFGPLSTQAMQRLEAWPADRLPDLIVALLDAPSLQALGLED
jgi:hypothetical protein